MGARRRVLVVGGAVLGVLGVWFGAPNAAAQPASGGDWVVALGDSYISGESARWAGNTDQSPSMVDAGGPTTYFDNATRTAEVIPGCHRAATSLINLGGGVQSANLACSGATTATSITSGEFKPGLDFYSDAAGRKGQALQLQEFARANRVRMVVVQIGGNNFRFGEIVQRCVTNFLTSPSWLPNFCHDDSLVTSTFSASNVAAQTRAITTALNNVRTAMRAAGYADTAWSMLLKTYPLPIPGGSGFRYPQSGYSRQSVGGCGFWNRDADWAATRALPAINGAVRNAVAATGATNVQILDVTNALVGRRLCESGVGRLEEVGVPSWRAPSAVDRTEWINGIRTVSAIGSPYFVAESLHPNYWGHLALRNCVRQAYNGGAVRGGSCVRAAPGLTALGEPNMRLG